MTRKRSFPCGIAAGFAAAAAVAALAAMGAGGAIPARADEAPVYEKEIHLVYSINNFGYTDVCG